MQTRVFVRCSNFVSMFVVAAALTACNYGEDSSLPASSAGSTSSSGTPSPVVSGTQGASTTASGDHAPQIFGAAAATASVGVMYSFQPTATDADGDALTFSLSGAPSWLKVNSATGLVSGTPTNADIGVDAGIVLQVSDGSSVVSLAPFTINVAAAAAGGGGNGTGSVDLAWVPPTENTDGSALSDLSGYRIYYGNASKNYTTTITISNPGLTSYVIESLPPGTYYFSVTATTSTGVQSAYSPEASTTIT